MFRDASVVVPPELPRRGYDYAGELNSSQPKEGGDA